MKMTGITTGVWGALLVFCVNTYAETVDQQSYLNVSEQQTVQTTHVWPDGAHYQGEWAKNQPHGLGNLTYANGAQYWGRVYQGRRQGQGVMKYANGDEYEGHWHKDQPQGKGVMRYVSGSVYEGDFKDGQQHGHGKQTNLDGTYYEGSWSQGKSHGYGKLTFISGGVYEGSFEDGRPHGKGHYYYPNGDVYSGEWRNGNQDGKGRIEYSTGGYYEGEFTEGMRHGQGTLVFAMGNQYSGPFKHNEAHGEGSCSQAGNSYPCRYRHNKLVKSITRNTAAVATTAVGATLAVAAKAPPAAKPTQTVKAEAKPKPEPKIAKVDPVKPAPKAEAVAKPKSAPKPVVKPFVPDTVVATKTQPAPTKSTGPAAAQKYAAATMSIPDSKQTFSQTLEQEKQKLKHLTVADLRQDRSDIYFSENWEAKDLMAIPERAWWQKRASLFADAMHFVSVHGDTEIRMIISDYKGPGTYRIKEAAVTSKTGNLDAEQLKSGEIVVESDDGKWISGSFQFEVSDGNGHQLAFNHGAFRLSSKEDLPRF
ncbi:MAG: hypothetical protein CMK89_15600 [Pseudomonadales bacterium]|nr:hypothetical protein [Pseudomonadales bacterium]